MLEKKSTLEYIKAIAEVKSVSLAAENLGISQPALSAYLKKHEKEVGALLFDRSKQPIELTEAGRAYIKYLDDAMALYKEFKQNLSDIDDLKTGSLTIGGASFFNVAYMPKAVGAFAKRYPGIEMEIIDGKVPELTTMALNGMLDLFITPIVDEEDRFVYEELLEEKIYIAVPRDWEINDSFKGEVLSAEEFKALCEEPFVVLKEDQHIGQKMEHIFESYGCRPEKTITAEQTMTSLALTAAGVGASLITESSLNSLMMKDMPRIYSTDPSVCGMEDMCRKMYVAYPKNKYLSNAAEEFIKVLKDSNR